MSGTIKCRAPMRISFAGGGTDVSPFCDDYGGAVINTAIARYSYVTLNRKDSGVTVKSLDYITGLNYSGVEELLNDSRTDMLTATLKNYLRSNRGYEISFFLDVPPRSGLGSSAAAFVALLTALNQAESLGMTKKRIAEEAWRLEREELKNIGGKQDQYASAFGGINFIEFSKEGVDISPLRVDDKTALELESRTLIFYFNQRGSSGEILEKQISNVKENKKDTIDALIRSREIAREMKRHMLNGDIDSIGSLLHEGWEQKKRFSSSISSSEIDRLYDSLRAKGALGGKISGAGGGGFMFVLCDEKKTIDVYHHLANGGYNPAFLKVDLRGVVTWST